MGKKFILCMLLFCQYLQGNLIQAEKLSKIADHVWGRTSACGACHRFTKKNGCFKSGDIIFVWADNIDSFVKHRKLVKKPYILIINGDDNTLTPRLWRKLNSKRLIHCYCCNSSVTHRKITLIPRGFEDDFWFKKRTKQSKIKQTEYYNPYKNPGGFIDKSSSGKCVYMNFNAGTYEYERHICRNIMKRKRFVKGESGVPLNKFLSELRKSTFVLSPAGNGIECHRTWESILVGTIPIIRPVCKHDNNVYCEGYKELYKDLPVIIVKDWNEVTEDFLRKKLEEFKGRTFNYEKLYFPYWRDLILKKSNEYK